MKKKRLKNKKGREVVITVVDKNGKEDFIEPEQGVKKVDLSEKMTPREIEEIMKDTQKKVPPHRKK